ncbi:hypothetical protein E4U17_002825 [Claviceps sp. LM77 group G4]|nr:hypothetical protein E4U17_002825 [Claviceps sp. LM77 group G4]KAG6073004.1 hypothetical protein E4U33_003081 [Claviceps sp. LM78 group G4]KAG6075834.1 hypothetical protein E4U16_003134 [Claviceps sp. LM84 group G4]
MQYPPTDIDDLSTRLPPLTHHDEEKVLPSLSSVTGVHSFRGRASREHHSHQTSHPSHSNWTPLNSYPTYRQTLPPPGPPPAPLSFHRAGSQAGSMDLDGDNSVASAPSPRQQSPSSMVTLDDPDVRLAAEALGDLRADFISSPPDTASLAALSPKLGGPYGTPGSAQRRSPHPEPLLSLLTTAHPLVASTIGGASTAYGGAKNFSPRFKTGAEYVEGYLTPLAKTVNSVGRVTGVEGGVRWFLGNRRQGGLPSSSSDRNAKKRRKVGSGDEGSSKTNRDMATIVGDFDVSPAPLSDRRSSSASTIDTLPAYDDMRSPAYSETASLQETPRASPAHGSWQSRLMTTTSGLSVAMSAESLKSLKYCLKWLRWTNGHMRHVICNLKTTLEEYEQTAEAHHATLASLASQQNEHEERGQDGHAERPTPYDGRTPEQTRTELTNKINTLKVDVLKTLQETINTVSKYAGGALPENARILVRRHLTSLPQRFRVASMTETRASRDGSDDSAVQEGAQKVLVLAKEGLDMVTQITGVLDGTIVSAEEWCERMGRGREPATNEGGLLEAPRCDAPEGDGDEDGDVKMGF